jgi:hypothetical protein
MKENYLKENLYKFFKERNSYYNYNIFKVNENDLFFHENNNFYILNLVRLSEKEPKNYLQVSFVLTLENLIKTFKYLF